MDYIDPNTYLKWICSIYHNVWPAYNTHTFQKPFWSFVNELFWKHCDYLADCWQQCYEYQFMYIYEHALNLKRKNNKNLFLVFAVWRFSLNESVVYLKWNETIRIMIGFEGPKRQSVCVYVHITTKTATITKT